MERDNRKKEEGKRKMRFSLSRGKQPERKQTERSVPVKSDLYHGHATHFNISHSGWIQVFRASSAQMYSTGSTASRLNSEEIEREVQRSRIDAKLATIANWHAGRCWWSREPRRSSEWKSIHATASLRINFTFHVPFCSLSFSRVSSSLGQVYRRSIVEIERRYYRSLNWN